MDWTGGYNYDYGTEDRAANVRSFGDTNSASSFVPECTSTAREQRPGRPYTDHAGVSTASRNSESIVRSSLIRDLIVVFSVLLKLILLRPADQHDAQFWAGNLI